MNKLNRLYTKYKYSHYCHDDNNNIFRNLRSISNYGEYFMVQALYNNNHKTNINIYYKYLDNRILFLSTIFPVFVSRTGSTTYTFPFEDVKEETVN